LIYEKKIRVRIKSIHQTNFPSFVNTAESRTIRSELERLHDENIELNKQRETLHITHDIQLKKLHDTYSNKLRDAEQWPDRLQSDLNREREQHRTQMNELERRLKESFITVCIVNSLLKINQLKIFLRN
jgi:exonuclease VII large subunit